MGVYLILHTFYIHSTLRIIPLYLVIHFFWAYPIYNWVIQSWIWLSTTYKVGTNGLLSSRISPISPEIIICSLWKKCEFGVISHLSTCMYIYNIIYIHIWIYIYIHTYIYIYTYMYVCMYVCMYIYITTILYISQLSHRIHYKYTVYMYMYMYIYI